MCCACCCKLLQSSQANAHACAWHMSNMFKTCCRAPKEQRVPRQGDPQPHPRELARCPPNALLLHSASACHVEAFQVPLANILQRPMWAQDSLIM